MQQPHFRREFGGYSSKEVDDYLAKLENENKEKISRQNNEMFRMRQEIYNLNESIELYKTNEDKMRRALDETMRKANELSKLSHSVYDLEVERLHLLYEQWSAMLSKMKQKFSALVSPQELDAIVGEFDNSLSITVNSQVKEDGQNFFASTQVSAVSSEDGIKQTHENAVNVSVSETSATVEKIERHTFESGGMSLVDKFLMGEDVEMPKSYGEVGPNLIAIPEARK